MTGEVILPPAAAPTYHPDIPGRYPRHNVFDLRPIGSSDDLSEGDVVNINLATYLDPFAESDSHRFRAQHAPWVQGMLLEIDAIKHATILENPRFRPSSTYSSVYPSDRVFAGRIINNDSAQLAVVGTMHPRLSGWLAFKDEPGFDNPQRPTIADLKALIGKISPEQATQFNERYRNYGEFLVGDQVLV